MKEKTGNDPSITIDIELLQRHQLDGLLDHGYITKFGKKYGFKADWSYQDFAKNVPITTYNSIETYIERSKSGASNQLWEGKTQRFAVSSGTTGDGKHLPITNERLHSDRVFLRQVARYALTKANINPISLLAGKHISLPGSIESVLYGERKHAITLGEISGHLADISPAWLNWFQVLPVNELIKLSFKDKFDRVVAESIQQDIRVINAVPSWTLILFQEVLERTGKSTVSEIWPHLKLVLGGGVAMRNYAGALRKLYGKPITFIETYGASEGYFAFGRYAESNSNSTTPSCDLKLIVGNGIFYEFLPVKSDNGEEKSEPIPLWNVDTDTPYSLIISTNAGLWRYKVGDIIEFTQLNPPKIIVTGRLDEMLDDYGEALRQYELDKALSETCHQLNCNLPHYKMGALHQNERQVPIHHWFLFGDENYPTQNFAKELDNRLQTLNRHYLIRRESGAIGAPKVWQLTNKQFKHMTSKMPTDGDTAQSKPKHILQSANDVVQLLELAKSR